MTGHGPTMRWASDLESESKPAIGAPNQNWEAMTNTETVTNTWVLARRGKHQCLRRCCHIGASACLGRKEQQEEHIVFVHSGQRPRRRHAPKENHQLREHCHARSDLLASPDHAIGSNHKTFALEDLSVQSNRRAILAHGTCRRII